LEGLVARQAEDITILRSALHTILGTRGLWSAAWAGARQAFDETEPRRSPPPPGSSDGDWDVWHLEVADWELCYQRRTLDWFDRQAERCNTEARLNVL